MKKVLLVTRASGFIPQHEMNNVKILQEMGFEVHYATNLQDVVYGKDNQRLQGTGIITHQIDFVRSTLPVRIQPALRQLEDLMLQESFDLIHCHMPVSGVLARKAANTVRKKTGRFVPVIYTAHGFHFFTGASWKNWCYYPVERHMARYTDRLITINREDYKRAKHFPLRGNAEWVPGVGIRLELFARYQKTTWDIETDNNGDGNTENIRKKYGIPDDYRILVSIGELAAGKNHLVMIEAMKELKDLKLVYLICGDGKLEPFLRDQVREFDLENRVIFAGYVEKPAEVLQQSDCFVFPSAREGLPVALMEAMAVGLPVVASDIRGNHDLIEHTKGGYLVHGFAPESYAVKIRRMFTEKEGKSAVPRVVRREQMGVWNRQKVKEFSLFVVETEMRRIYQEVISSK